jgi:Bcr/CflA subfamily drug resistance transporter
MKNRIKDSSKIDYKVFFVMLLTFFTLGQVASDIYVPSLPAITHLFHSTSSMIQWSVATYMLGFSLSQLFYGPISDFYGRRIVIFCGLTISIIGTLFCVFSGNPLMLIIGRLVQGLGMGVTAVLGRAVLRDCFSGEELARFGSFLGIGTTLTVGSAPIIGGYFQHYLNWQSVFIFLFVYSLAIVVLVYLYLPETSPEHKNKFNLLLVGKNYWSIISSRIFLGYTFCALFAYAGSLAFFAMSPFLLQNRVGLSVVEYSWSTAIITASFLISGMINAKFVVKFGINRMLKIGSMLAVLAGVLMLLPTLMHVINVVVILLPAALFGVAAILLLCNAFPGAFGPFKNIAGAAGAVYGCLQIAGGFVSTSLIATLHFKDQEPLALIYIAAGMFSFLALTQLALKGNN